MNIDWLNFKYFIKNAKCKELIAAFKKGNKLHKLIKRYKSELNLERKLHGLR